MSTKLQRSSVALLALLALTALALVTSGAAAQRVRVIVLSFEGTQADRARDAAVHGLETTYEMVDEQAAIDAAGEIGVDVSTPEGMSAVVSHLGIELVIGGYVEGRGRTATTTVWVSDVNGNELARRTAGPPTGRGAAEAIGTAALEAAIEAHITLRPPEPPPDEDTPIFADDEDDEEDVFRPEPPVDTSGRWRQPLIRGLVGIDLRNRNASASFDGMGLDFFATDFFPSIEIAIDSHPLAFLPGPENGLYLSLRTGFSAGLTYAPFNLADVESLTMNVYHLDFDAGYAGIIANLLEIGGTLGMGLDAVGLETPPMGYVRGDFPSVEYFHFRPGIFARLRAYQDYLIVAFGLGGRILIGAGQINNFEVPTGLPLNPSDYWGIAGGGGVDLNIGLEGIIDPGFSYAARFGYTGHFIGFSDDVTGAAERNSASDEAFHILLMIGWAYVPPGGAAPPSEGRFEREPEPEPEETPPGRDIDNEAPPPDPDW